MNIDADSSYSRLPAKKTAARAKKSAPTATRGQKAIELTLFGVFGLTIALAGVALYATNTAEHNRVPNRVSAGITADRVNILLIGASLRTDNAPGTTNIRPESLMLVSIQPSTGRTALTSIPADLWVKVGRYGQRPLRAAYQVGESSGYPGAGTGLLVDTLAKIIDEPIHGYARVSIGDISRVVDTIGGIDVDVKRGVYEVRGDRHRFRRGQQRFDGISAMHYAYAGGVAGFAADRFEREQRQREVALSTLTKLLATNPDLARLNSVLGSVAQTNLTANQIATLFGAARRGGSVAVVSFKPYLDTIDVTSVAYRGEAVQPHNGDFQQVRRVTDAVFEAGVVQVQFN